MSALLGTFWPYLLAAGAAFATIIGAFLNGKKAGADKEKAKVAAERLAARTEADKIDHAVAGMTDEEVMKEQAKWSRPKR